MKKNVLISALCLCAVTSVFSVAEANHHHTKRTHDDGISFPYVAPQQQLSYLKKVDPAHMPYMSAQSEAMEAWQDDRFGVFIHWDHSSQEPVSMSWGRKGPRPHHKSDGKVKRGLPEQQYNDLDKTFNPVKFNAAEWMQTIADSGAKYVVFTAKHHAGFSMWDTKVGDYDIINTPYAKDVTRDLVTEARKRGLKFHFYYSQPDWTHPLYRSAKKLPSERFNREVLFPQIKELLTQYGKIDGIWFDGLGKSIDTWYGPELITMMRKLQPHLVVNHRWGRPTDRFGDYDGPERKIGRFQINRPWETCTVIGGGWGWMGDGPAMSYTDVMTLLSKTVSRGGNLLLNTGPNGLGEIHHTHVERYKQMGQWLGQYGESVYGTRGGPYIDGPWGGATRKGKDVYLHLYGQVGETLSLPALPGKLQQASLITGGKVQVEQKNGRMLLTLDAKGNSPFSVVKLSMDSDMSAVPVITTVGQPVTLAAKGSSSSDKSAKFSAKAMIEGSATSFSEGINISASWMPKPSDKSVWLQSDFGEAKRLQMIELSSSNYGKVIPKNLGYTVKAKIDGKWRSIYQSQQLLVDNGIMLPEPIEASALRVEFTQARGLNIGGLIAYPAL